MGGEASPRFRSDLIATAAQADGMAFVDVRDPRNGSSFRLYDFEYDLALQLNGQSLDGVVGWAAATYQLDLTPEGIGEFAARLGELGFLQSEGHESDDGPPVSQVVNHAVSQ